MHCLWLFPVSIFPEVFLTLWIKFTQLTWKQNTLKIICGWNSSMDSKARILVFTFLLKKKVNVTKIIYYKLFICALEKLPELNWTTTITKPCSLYFFLYYFLFIFPCKMLAQYFSVRISLLCSFYFFVFEAHHIFIMTVLRHWVTFFYEAQIL